MSTLKVTENQNAVFVLPAVMLGASLILTNFMMKGKSLPVKLGTGLLLGAGLSAAEIGLLQQGKVKVGDLVTWKFFNVSRLPDFGCGTHYPCPYNLWVGHVTKIKYRPFQCPLVNVRWEFNESQRGSENPNAPNELTYFRRNDSDPDPNSKMYKWTAKYFGSIDGTVPPTYGANNDVKECPAAYGAEIPVCYLTVAKESITPMGRRISHLTMY